MGRRTREVALAAELAATRAALASAQEELHRAAAAKAELLARVSHELRTPLTVVAGFGRVLLLHGDRLEPSVRQECLQAIVRSAWRLEGLIAELLDAARVDGRLPPATPRAVTVAELIDGAVATGGERLRPDAVAGGDLEVLADVEQLTSVLGHLLSNADRYGERPVAVTAARDDDGRIELAVTDRGPGVPEAFVPRLFERFEQASTGDRREASGVGLGLFLVRTLVEANGGSVAYAPTSPSGARFELRLPAAVGAGHPAPSPAR